MAEESENFSTLNDMVTEAKKNGAQAFFGKPSLDADSLSNIITNLASSLTTSRSEMTELRTGKAKLLRMDIEREKLNTPDHIGGWKEYTNCGSLYVRRYWSWSYRQVDGFVPIVDTRCAYCYDEDAEIECPGCNAYFVCGGCSRLLYGQDIEFKAHRSRYDNPQSECEQNLAKIRMGSLRHKELPSFSIAVKDRFFGEGAERIVRKGMQLL